MPDPGQAVDQRQKGLVDDGLLQALNAADFLLLDDAVDHIGARAGICPFPVLALAEILPVASSAKRPRP